MHVLLHISDTSQQVYTSFLQLATHKIYELFKIQNWKTKDLGFSFNLFFKSYNIGQLT